VPSSFFSAGWPFAVAVVQFDGFAGQIVGFTYFPPKMPW
jgi:hypothetical protein